MDAKKSFLISLFLLLFATSGYCQRTADGEFQASAAFKFGAYTLGAELNGGVYLLDSYIGGGASFISKSVSISNQSGSTDFARFGGFAEWMWRFFGTRKRNLNFYVGGDVLLGGEILDPYSRLSSSTRKSLEEGGYKDSVFIYGVTPKVSAEFFFTRMLALYAHIAGPFTFNSQSKNFFDVEYAVGIRANF